MKLSLVAIVPSLVALASARHCVNLTVPVSISARNGKFDLKAPVTNIDVTDFVLDNTQLGKNYTKEILEGYATVSGIYHIAATYCQPDSGPAKTLQILTHGIGFTRTYWDVPFNNYNYSYVCDAVDHYGYSTFTYDRLGIGQSEHGDPVNVIQAWLEIQALRALTLMLQKGQIPGVPHGFEKFVHGGHSFGSIQSYTLTQMYPTISDGLVLTGFGNNGSFVPDFMYGGNFIQANTVPALAAYPDGYLTSGDPSGVQTNFFAPGDFDPAILTYAYKNGGPVTVGELLTTGAGTGAPSTFAGPVLVITGERDVPFCGGNCYAAPAGFPSIPAQSKAFLPNAKDFQAVIVPGAGHGLNLQYSHDFTYSHILNYLVNNGLGPK